MQPRSDYEAHKRDEEGFAADEATRPWTNELREMGLLPHVDNRQPAGNLAAVGRSRGRL